MLQTPEENLQKTGFALPPAPKPAGVYKPMIQVENLVYVSGHGPVLDEGILIKGNESTNLSNFFKLVLYLSNPWPAIHIFPEASSFILYTR